MSEAISPEEFLTAYAERSGTTPGALILAGRVVVECNCGDEICKGWALVPGDCLEPGQVAVLEWRSADEPELPAQGYYRAESSSMSWAYGGHISARSLADGTVESTWWPATVEGVALKHATSRRAHGN